MLSAAPSRPELLMIPSMGTTATLLADPWRSSTTSSRRVSLPNPAPAALNTRLKKKCATFENRLTARQTASSSVAIFQPRPAFDFFAGRIGGGSGGGVGGGRSFSITAHRLLHEPGVGKRVSGSDRRSGTDKNLYEL